MSVSCFSRALRIKRDPYATLLRIYVSRHPLAPNLRLQRRPRIAGFAAYLRCLHFCVGRQKHGTADLMRIYVSRRSCCVICDGTETQMSRIYGAAASLCLARPGQLARLMRMCGVCGLIVVACMPRKVLGVRFGCPRRDAWTPMRAQSLRICGVFAMAAPRDCRCHGRFHAYLRYAGVRGTTCGRRCEHNSIRICSVLAVFPPRGCRRQGRFHAYLWHHGMILCLLWGT